MTTINTQPEFASRLAQPQQDYFDTAVAADGYRWWYLDVVSDDGNHSLVIIGFIGSVFSPYYAAARRRGAGDPYAHCAMNAILYSKRGKRWAMTERTADKLVSEDTGIRIGQSSMHWVDGNLVVEIDELNPEESYSYRLSMSTGNEIERQLIREERLIKRNEE